jgi:uncharacterized protein YydD (DUF2326 family)
MGEKRFAEKYAFLEKQVHDYMKVLLVKTPEQVVQYFEKRLAKYKALIEKREAYPESAILYMEQLIGEYSANIAGVKEYIKYKQETTFNPI